MTLVGDFLARFTYTAMIMVLYCKADQCAPPTGLTYEWLDKFVVNISWKKPTSVPDNNDIEFRIRNTEPDVRNTRKSDTCTTWSNFTDEFLTEKMGSDQLKYKISTVKHCNYSNESNSAYITIPTLKPRAKVMRDFKCLVTSNETLNCSWIPLNRSLSLTLSHRITGKTQEDIKSLKKCDQPYSGERDGCYLHIDTTPNNIYILLETDTEMNTFKPVLVVPPPKLTITENEDDLILSWTPPNFGSNNCWMYEIHSKQCDIPMKSRNTTPGENRMLVRYNKNCHYQFQYRVMGAESCLQISSDLSANVSYGMNKTDRTMTVIAIVIPIILSLCVILSCYCFRRHSAIICPTIPDPSALFKEMIMNGNKELKPSTGSLYTPVPEPIEPCKITPISENTVLQHNS